RGERLAGAELVDNLRLLTIAGHETTAALLAWMMVVLAERPDLWAGLCAEALFRETLRVHPISPFTGRMVYEPIELCGHTLQKGVVVYVGLPLLLRDP